LTWASDSSPDIARNEWPNAMRMPINPISAPAFATRLKCGSTEACSGEAAGGASGFAALNARGGHFGLQPTASALKTRLRGAGEGGKRCIVGLIKIVNVHQPISSTTIAVVTYIIRSASSEDSRIPRVLRHQK